MRIPTGRQLAGPQALFFAQQRETDSLVETSSAFHIGLGDRFAGDRRRVYQSEMTERPADTERKYDKWNFSGSCGGVDRWSFYAGCFANVDVRDNDLSPHDG